MNVNKCMASVCSLYWDDPLWRTGGSRGGRNGVVLIVLLAIAAWSSSFVWLMNQQLTRAGARYRSAAALAVAEAGVHRALSILEGVAPDAPLPGRTWRTEEYAETIRLGSFDGQF